MSIEGWKIRDLTDYRAVGPISRRFRTILGYPILKDFPHIAKNIVYRDIEEVMKAPSVPDGPIIDIGCGSGILVKTLRDAGYDSYGIEITRDRIDDWKRYGISDYCFLGDAENMEGIPNSSIAAVITTFFWDTAFGVDEDTWSISPPVWNSPEKILSEIERVLKPKGVFMPLRDPDHHGRIDAILMKKGFKRQKDVFIKLENPSP